MREDNDGKVVIHRCRCEVDPRRIQAQEQRVACVSSFCAAQYEPLSAQRKRKPTELRLPTHFLFFRPPGDQTSDRQAYVDDISLEPVWCCNLISPFMSQTAGHGKHDRLWRKSIASRRSPGRRMGHQCTNRIEPAGGPSMCRSDHALQEIE